MLVLSVQLIDQLLDVEPHDLGVSVYLSKACINDAKVVECHDHRDAGRDLLDGNSVGRAFWTPDHALIIHLAKIRLIDVDYSFFGLDNIL